MELMIKSNKHLLKVSQRIPNAQAIINSRLYLVNKGWSNVKIANDILIEMASAISEMFGGRQATKNRIYHNIVAAKPQSWVLRRIQLETHSDGTIEWSYCVGQDALIEYPQARKILSI